MAYANFLLPTIVLLGIGFALTFPSITSQGTAGVHDDEQGLASGLVNTSVQVGGAVMMAVVTAILASSHRASEPGELLGGMTTAIWVVSGLSVIGLLGAIGVAWWSRVRARSVSLGVNA